jgi:hypothetical protein
VLGSIGYRTLPLPGLPFDAKRAVVQCAAGGSSRVADCAGVYCTGWARRGESPFVLITVLLLWLLLLLLLAAATAASTTAAAVVACCV